jgi:hypothetical protein
MSIKNVILGFCAAGLAIGSAIASVSVPPYIAVGANGEERTIGNISPCANAGRFKCRVKLVRNGTTIPGFTIATVFTAGGTTLTSNSNFIRTIVVN